MGNHLKVLFVAADSGFLSDQALPPSGDFFGPVDLGLHLSAKHNSLNIGSGLLAGSILPGCQSPDRQRVLAVLGRVLYFYNGGRCARL